jgi:AraC family transcriptional regulator, regulatory protein of adaptative response / methylated-DNA-[protein]-cysteine methyltransferase
MLFEASNMKNSSNNKDVFWHAVETKDARFNGTFFFAVQTTGIYCKPSCAARTPKRQNVVFFDTQKTAEKEGFRACRRCKPNSVTERDPQVEMVLKVCQLVEDNLEENVSLEFLGEAVKISPHHLQRTFKSILGITPKQYATALKIKSFKEQVQRGEDVTGAMYEAGFGSSRALYEKAADTLGMTPAAYKSKGKGMNITYTVTDSDLGKMLVAKTERGICSVTFGDTEKELVANLKNEFAAAEIAEDKSGLNLAVKSILDLLDGKEKRFALPLDVKATAFQLQVWETLRKIPYGETRSYKQVAESIGKPSAVRAVARACATNPTALITPCHRVVRENGELSGYRWGVERKKEILAKEASQK